MLTTSVRVVGGAAAGSGADSSRGGADEASTRGLGTGVAAATFGGAVAGAATGAAGASGDSTPTRPHHARTSSAMRDLFASVAARRQNCQSDG
jgi:hypothetical protein